MMRIAFLCFCFWLLCNCILVSGCCSLCVDEYAIHAWLEEMPYGYYRAPELGNKYFLREKEWEARGRAISSAGKWLAAEYRKEVEFNKKYRLISALGIIGDEDSVDELVAILVSDVVVNEVAEGHEVLRARAEDESYKMKAVDALCEIGSDYVVKCMNRVLTTKNDVAKGYANDVLRTIYKGRTQSDGTR